MMAKEVRIAFEQQVLLLALDDILPSKMLAPPLKATADLAMGDTTLLGVVLSPIV